MVTTGPAIVEVLVTAGKVEVNVAKDVRVTEEVSVENEVTVTGSSKGGKSQSIS